MLFHFQFLSIKSWKIPNFLIFSPKDTEEEPQTVLSLKLDMPEKASKRKGRRDSPAISVEEPEAACQRAENAPSISGRDFSEISERVEKSVCSRLKETETNQREILKMIENRSSKIDSLCDKNLLELSFLDKLTSSSSSVGFPLFSVLVVK